LAQYYTVMDLDILAFGAHPDDVELSAAGTLLRHVKKGDKVGIVDLTKGEMGTRGSAETRSEESKLAGILMGVSIRQNLELPDGFIEVNGKTKILVAEQIRRFRPKVVLCNAVADRHPDHGIAAQLVTEACFIAGLIKVETTWEGVPQECWRPPVVYHYIQDRYVKPDLVVDISEFFEQKMDVVMAYKSQFYNKDSKEPESPISGPEFRDHIMGRAVDFGRLISVSFGEGFTTERAVGVDMLSDVR